MTPTDQIALTEAQAALARRLVEDGRYDSMDAV